MKILITGFEAFGGESINPSTEIIHALPEYIAGAEIIKAKIPTAICISVEMLKEIIEKHKPDVVINIGQAGGRMRSEINVERIAININDFPIPDNIKNMPVDERIIDDAPDGYFLTLPIKKIVDALKKENIPATVSNTAGTYICNYVAFCMAHLSRTDYPDMKTGFIHVPYLPQQVIEKSQIPHMSLDMMIRAIETTVRIIVQES